MQECADVFRVYIDFNVVSSLILLIPVFIMIDFSKNRTLLINILVAFEKLVRKCAESAGVCRNI